MPDPFDASPDDRADPAIALLAELIAKPSLTPEDAGCQALLGDRLAAIGFDCEAMPFAEVSNLWARRGTQAPLLCFAGHTDVVPAGPLDDWNTAPFVPVVADGKMFGRGAADMKGGLAAMVTAVERFVADHEQHRGSIAFLLTSDEEGPAVNGTRKVVEALQRRGDWIDYCVVGEPSSRESVGDVVRIGRRGSLTGKLTVKGVQGHVAYPEQADNPIARFAPVLMALQETVWDAGNERFPPTSFQIVNLHAGIGTANVIPGELHAEFNLRYSTEWTHEALRKEIAALIARFDVDFELEWHLSGEPFVTDGGTLIDAVSDGVRAVTGKPPELSTGGGTSDGRFIAPGGAEVAELGLVNATIHQVNEHVATRDVIDLSRMYQRILEILLVD